MLLFSPAQRRRAATTRYVCSNVSHGSAATPKDEPVADTFRQTIAATNERRRSRRSRVRTDRPSLVFLASSVECTSKTEKGKEGTNAPSRCTPLSRTPVLGILTVFFFLFAFPFLFETVKKQKTKREGGKKALATTTERCQGRPYVRHALESMDPEHDTVVARGGPFWDGTYFPSPSPFGLELLAGAL